MREIEVKIRVVDLSGFRARLQAEGCVFSEVLEQYDVIYAETKSPFVPGESKQGYKALRIRRENGRAIFNMKVEQSNELDCIEEETEVKNPEAMHQILLALGFRPEIEVRKKRVKTKYKDYELCLDEVEGLGSFVEIEKMVADDSDPIIIQEELLQVLESFGLSRENQERRGYDNQIYQLEHQ